MTGLPQKSKEFFWSGIYKLSQSWEKGVKIDGQYFEQVALYHIVRINVFFTVRKFRFYMHTPGNSISQRMPRNFMRLPC